MVEKQQHSCAGDSHSCSSKFVCPLSLVSLLICTAALVRVEIINQRVHTVEDLVADARQIQNLIKVSTTEASSKDFERVDTGGEFDHKITKEGKDATEGKAFQMLSLYVTTLRIAILLGNYNCSLSVWLVSVCARLRDLFK